MDKYNVKYVPSWSKKSPCEPKKRSKLTVCGNKAEDISGTTTEEPSPEASARLDESKEDSLKRSFDVRNSPAYSWDDMAVRLIAPLPSEYVRCRFLLKLLKIFVVTLNFYFLGIAKK